MNKYNLLDILTKEVEFEEVKYKFSGIQIPMIQRDYAHGRIGESEIRKRFLKNIFEALESDKPMELDFIYGTKATIDNNDLFIPLDGQQRLTTLFLINWYIGNRELENKELDELRRALGKFSYATRHTSAKFCEKLSEISLMFNISPSEEIKNSSWFFDTYIFDPTVQSMLNMLDSIHLFYEEKQKCLYDSLNKITFYLLPLDGFDLTDELYIKMNARGKQLTSFENFKADLVKWVKSPDNEFKEEFHKEVNYNNFKLQYYISFEMKIDNSWTSLFWNYSKKNEEIENKLPDKNIMQFWNRYLLNYYIVSSDLNQDAFENNDIFKFLYGYQGDDSKFKYNDFNFYEKILIQENVIKRIEKVFDELVLYFDKISKILQPSWEINNKWDLFSERINQRQRIILFATTIYLERNSFDEGKFRNWIRIVWNLIIDPNIRSVPAMVGAMRFIIKLSKYSEDINAFLMNPKVLAEFSGSIYDHQLEEEYFKLNLINVSNEWEEVIIESESHFLFQGNIRFLIKDSINTELEYFKRSKKISFAIFENNSLGDNPEDYLWVRALLTKINNIQLPITLSNGRYNNWRILINNELIDAMRLLIDDLYSNSLPTKESMKFLISNYKRDSKKNWIYPLVTWVGKDGETLLGNYSITRKIQIYNNYGRDPDFVYLYNQTIWTNNNLLISNLRNEIIKMVLNNSSNIFFPLEEHNIQNSFFTGRIIKLVRIIDDIEFIYTFENEFLTIKIKSSNEDSDVSNNLFIENEDEKFVETNHRKFNYNEIIFENQIDSFLEKIEVEVFSLDNSESLLSKYNSLTNHQ
jgi:hypothetical protein